MRGRSKVARRTRIEGGFTLLELIIVVAIIGVLAGIAMPALRDVPRRAAEAVLRTNLTTFRNVIDQYYADRGTYPPSLEALVDEGYLRRIPRDPITRETDSWVIEYQEIDPEFEPAETDLPEGGAPGIIDVRSGSDQLSLDGTPYSDW